MSAHYSNPPWRTYGSGLAIPCIVPTRDVHVPDEFSIVGSLGRTLGMLVYLEYRDPSPVVHRELIWLSAIVRCKDRAYRTPEGIGPMYYVARMYGDSDLAIDAARKEWSLPKTYAHFRRQGNSIDVRADDGTHVAFSWKPRRFTFRAPTEIATLQKGFGRIVCFRASGRAEVQLATYRMDAFETEQPEWEGFRRRLVLPGVASLVRSFESTVRAPVEMTRRLESMAPAAAPSLVRLRTESV
ncbi:MAG: hypothetical protein ABW352_11110 [Polyangiales bacterium]